MLQTKVINVKEEFMIKIDVQETPDTYAISLVSNNIEADRDKVDLIGALILSSAEKRGRFVTESQSEILVLKKQFLEE